MMPETYTARQREDMERVALDQLHRTGQLPVRLPALGDDRLRALAALLRADPADGRTLAEFGLAVGASERNLSRLFRQQAGPGGDSPGQRGISQLMPGIAN